MIETLLLLLAISLVLVFDLGLIAARAGYLQSSTVRLLGQRDASEARVSLVVAYLAVLPRLRVRLNLALILARFMLAGLVVRLAAVQQPPLNLLVEAGMLLATALLLFGLEWSVEQVVSRSPEVWALRLAAFVHLWMFVTTGSLSPHAGPGEIQTHPETPGMVTEDDLKTLVDASQEDGVLEQDERRMIYSVFELRNKLAREIMVPRIDMITLDVQTPLVEAVDAVLEYGHSRLPVYEETVEHTLGLLYAKDLLRVFREGGHLNSLRDLLRPAYFIPEAKKADELLAEMQAQRIHMAIVVDEYGGIAGLVTLEDIVEEILGEIQDEYDQGEEAPYQQSKDGTYLFQGRVDLDDFNEIMGSSLTKDEADTIGGFIYGVLGRVPTVGEKVRKDRLLLTVEQVSARRIRKVRAGWLPPDDLDIKENQHADG